MDLNESRSDLKFSKLLLTLIVLLFTFTACQESTTDKVEVPSDEEITEAVQSQFSTSAAVPEEDINVQTKDGIVTINGSTTNLLAKNKATELAQKVHGALSVVNNLKISTERPDDIIETDITRALATDPATEPLEISVGVQNGLVTLKGAVDSWQEKQLAGTIAKGVKGVKELNNTIIVNPQPTRSEEDIKYEIEQTLKMNSEIRNAKIDVQVDSNRVTLSGAVGSAYEKQLAADYSHVVGVDSVVADELEVHPEFRSDLLQNNELDVLTDEEISNAIRNALTYDPRVPEDKIGISINEDVATLSGTVNNLNAKLAAESDARNTAGVKAVENNIAVEKKVLVDPEVPVTDEAIQTRIGLAIERDPYLEDVNVSISVNEGYAVLEGEVDSQFKKKQIEEVASNVKGVLAIKNNISVIESTET